MKIVSKLRLLDSIDWFHNVDQYLQNYYGLVFEPAKYGVKFDDPTIESKPLFKEIEVFALDGMACELKRGTIRWYETPIYSYYQAWPHMESFIHCCFDIPDDNVAIMMRLALP